MQLFSPFLAYNAIGWVIGGISLSLFGYQIYRIDRKLSTQLTRHYILYCSALGGGMLVFALPGLFIADTGVLKFTYLIGEALIDFSLVYQAWIVAHFIVGSNFAKRAATLLTGIVAAFLWVMQVLSPTPYRLAHDVVWPMNTGAHWALAAIMSILLIPVTMFFFKQSLTVGDSITRIKSFSTGFTCAVIFVQYMILMFHYHDVAPIWASIINIISFSGFLIALLIPRKLTETVIVAQLPSAPADATPAV
ncbi:MAG: hypothetical protein ABIS59_01275 [Candidatus Saccharibacteria bacterium]